MRKPFCNSMVSHATDPRFVFLTGDLGFMALEPLREAMGARFINAGVAEQNMVTVAAGLAKSGLRPWTYSIAPFLYARPFEQIRNDVCLHDLPVILVGNGGGYGYGVMGATHHAIEDYGSLLCLPHMRAFMPAFDMDIEPIVNQLFSIEHPAYLRLGLGEEPKDATLPAYAPWRKLLDGDGPTIVAVGPLAGGLLGALQSLPTSVRPCLWVLTELPIVEFPEEFMVNLKASQHLMVLEEHVAQGGAGHIIAHRLLLDGRAPKKFTHRFAQGYPSQRYGSQKFHRRENGLDAASVQAFLETLTQGAR